MACLFSPFLLVFVFKMLNIICFQYLHFVFKISPFYYSPFIIHSGFYYSSVFYYSSFSFQFFKKKRNRNRQEIQQRRRRFRRSWTVKPVEFSSSRRDEPTEPTPHQMEVGWRRIEIGKFLTLSWRFRFRFFCFWKIGKKWLIVKNGGIVNG